MSSLAFFAVWLQLLFAESFSVSSSVSEFGSDQRLCTKKHILIYDVVLLSWLSGALMSVNKTLICMEILKSECTVILDFHSLYLPQLSFYSCPFPNELFYVFSTGISFLYVITFKAESELKLWQWLVAWGSIQFPQAAWKITLYGQTSQVHGKPNLNMSNRRENGIAALFLASSGFY